MSQSNTRVFSLAANHSAPWSSPVTGTTNQRARLVPKLPPISNEGASRDEGKSLGQKLESACKAETELTINNHVFKEKLKIKDEFWRVLFLAATSMKFLLLEK